MENRKIIHLEEPNTLSNFLTKEERKVIVSLKITGYIGQKDFEDVLDEMCDACGEYDEHDNFIPDYESICNIFHKIINNHKTLIFSAFFILQISENCLTLHQFSFQKVT
jgi:hypothetical protein